MLPSAPLTFSMMMGCLSEAFMRSARSRPTTSVGPPAANGTIMVMGRDGYVCAVATLENVGATAAAPANCRNFRRGRFMAFPPEMQWDDETRPSDAAIVDHTESDVWNDRRPMA